MLAEQIDRRQLGLAHEVIGAGQQHRDRAGLRHRLRIRLVGMFEMISRERTMMRGEAGAVQCRELLGMELDGQASGARGVEHAVGLLGGEADPLTEGVHRIRETDRSRDHGVTHEVDIIVGAVGIFGRQRVRAEQRGRDPHVAHFAQRTRRAEHLEFVLDGEAIA